MMRLQKIILWLMFYYPFLYLTIQLLNPDLTGEFSVITLVLLCIFINLQLLQERKIVSFIILYSLLLLYTSFVILKYGVSYFIHVDNYGLMLLLLVFLFSNTKNMKIYEAYAVKRERSFLILLVLYFLIIGLTVIIGTGLYGSRDLMGPFDLPHALSYVLLGFYCLSSFYFRLTQKTIYLVFKLLIALCVIWTAVRTAVLALIILLLVDFKAIKGLGRKVLIVYGLICVLVSLAFFTDIITNNPVVTKTLDAAERGSVTNGREFFASVIMDNYLNQTTVLEKLTGIGLGEIRSIMFDTVRVNIHAHNDYINVLVGYGIVGFIIFLMLQIKFCKSKHFLFLFAFVFILAYFNGIYMYTMFTVSLPSVKLFFCYRENID